MAVPHDLLPGMPRPLLLLLAFQSLRHRTNSISAVPGALGFGSVAGSDILPAVRRDFHRRRGVSWGDIHLGPVVNMLLRLPDCGPSAELVELRDRPAEGGGLRAKQDRQQWCDLRRGPASKRWCHQGVGQPRR